ncbi:MAG: hypothetical protein JF567_08395 [Xanthomonadales bacterium]|nr:hypothetical protein [Xanthomonadales bacterium]
MMPSALRRLLPILLSVLPLFAHAQGFSILVSPPRFEDTTKAGAVYRNVIEINNTSPQATHLSVKTADWTLGPDSAVAFSSTLAADSCRPWVGIEANEVAFAGKGKRRFRFEVAVPANTPSGECRFAIMLEGDPQAVKGNVPVPVSGRIGVIVYLTIGDAHPQLQVAGSKAVSQQGRIVPVLRVQNSGYAHGRLEGFIDGRDAAGHKFTFVPSNLPILRGETRDIALVPQGDNDTIAAPAITYPLTLKGQLDYDSRHLVVDTSIAR